MFNWFMSFSAFIPLGVGGEAQNQVALECQDPKNTNNRSNNKNNKTNMA